MTSSEREDYLQREGVEEGVRREIAALLECDEVRGDAFDEAWLSASRGTEAAVPADAGGMPSIRPGAVLGDFRLEEEIGRGGMAVVYRAQQISLDRTVALKVLCFPLMSEAVRRRFQREAAAGAQLHHENIVTVHQFGKQDDLLYFAMELIEGPTLAGWLDRQRSQCTKPSQGASDRHTQVCRWAADVADGLAHAHASGVIHLDIKPSNLILTPDGRVKILDFGVAKLHREAGLTATGTLLGTPRYMSPEQLLSSDKETDHRADIYSLGATLYELLTLDPPYPGDDLSEVIGAICSSDPRPLRKWDRSIPRTLEAICLRAMARDPRDRYQHAEQLTSDLRAHLTGDPVLAMRRYTLSRLMRAARRNRFRIATTVVMVLAVFGFATMFERQPRLTLENREYIWQDEGYTTDPSFSYDGRCLVVSSDRGREGHADIWMQEFDRNGIKQGDPIQLTFERYDEVEPALSPDHRFLAWCEFGQGGGLLVQEIRERRLDGKRRRIDEHGRGPKFSPDGRWLAYWRGSIGRDLGTGGDSIWIVPIAGGAPRRICPDFAWVGHPVWSPDSSKLLFRGIGPEEDEGRSESYWWITPIAGGPVKPVNVTLRKQHVENPRYCVPTCWTPHGDHAIFAGFVGQGFNLVGVPMSPHTARVGESYPITQGGNSELHADADANGRCCYADMEFDYGIFRLPIDANRGTVTGPLSVVAKNQAMEVRPSATEDGDTIVFSTDRDGDFDVFAQIGGGSVTRVIDGRGSEEMYCVISPNGDKLAFRRSMGDGASVDRGGLRVADLEEGVAKGERKLTDVWEHPLDWHPSTPTRLLLVKRGLGLQCLDTETGEHQPVLYRDDWNIDCGRFSPDGRWIAFSAHSANDDRRKQVFVSRFDEVTPIEPGGWIPISDGAGDHSPDWSPDGNIVYYLSDRDGRRDVWRRTVEPRSKQPLGTARRVYRFSEYRRSPLFADSTQLPLTVTEGQLLFWLGDCTGNVYVGNLELR